jgi:hypothetical protein
MIPDHDARLQPAEPRIGPCRHCPGHCPIDDHDDEGCTQHPKCPGFQEYTAADELEDAQLQRAGQ